MSAWARKDTQVLIAGAGPIGLTDAIELASRGVDFRIVDPLTEPPLYAKAVGVQPRTFLEIFESMGVLRRVLDDAVQMRGQIVYVNGRSVGQVDIVDLLVGTPPARNRRWSSAFRIRRKAQLLIDPGRRRRVRKGVRRNRGDDLRRAPQRLPRLRVVGFSNLRYRNRHRIPAQHVRLIAQLIA